MIESTKNDQEKVSVSQNRQKLTNNFLEIKSTKPHQSKFSSPADWNPQNSATVTAMMNAFVHQKLKVWVKMAVYLTRSCMENLADISEHRVPLNE